MIFLVIVVVPAGAGRRRQGWVGLVGLAGWGGVGLRSKGG